MRDLCWVHLRIGAHHNRHSVHKPCTGVQELHVAYASNAPALTCINRRLDFQHDGHEYGAEILHYLLSFSSNSLFLVGSHSMVFGCFD